MNRTLISCLLAITAAASASAFADDITIEDHPFVPTLTREQVRGELAQFKASGVDPWAENYDPLAGFASTKTRAQVTAEYLQSRDEVSAFTGEDSGSTYLAAGTRRGMPPVYAGAGVSAQ